MGLSKRRKFMLKRKKPSRPAPTKIPVESVGVKKMKCPECCQSVPVGGPINDMWNVLRHVGLDDDVTKSCLGTSAKIQVSPR